MSNVWFTEELHPYYRKALRVKAILEDEQTPISICRCWIPSSSVKP